ncbi:hypothetical protein SSX86_002851 [Deinandra increscens subsp. villosa]|uniref:Integrase catalytic domain-containing protein n=1 Tax=Deinandra increscens subsp. villosa TaxID=3103831 RepID=A0AAP0H8D9_9ASTR
MSTTKYEIEKFDGKNDFGLWRVKMKALLVYQGIADALLERPEGITDAKWNEKLAKAKSAIILSLGDKVLREVSREASAASMWSKLENLYMTKSLANRMYLKKKLYTFSMNADKSLDEHSDEFNKIILGLENIDIKGGFGNRRCNGLMAALNSRELKRKVEPKESSGDGLYVRGRSEQRGFRNRSQGRSKSRGKTRCYVCNSDKHLKRDCLERKKKYESSSYSKDQGNVSTSDPLDGYDSSDVLVVSSTDIDQNWILDSGCSYHMTPHKHFFSKLDLIDMVTVKLGDSRPCKIMGQGIVELVLDNGTHLQLDKVRYIPDLTRNLLSLGTFEKNGFNVSLKNGKAKIIKGSMVVLTGTRCENNVYLLDGRVKVELNNAVTHSEDSDSILWHNRLGHISDQGLMELKKQQVLKGYKGTGKHNSKGILDYAHADLWGPARTESLGGARYFLSIIDDFSRRVWVIILKTKDEAFRRFKEWKIAVENQYGKKLKKLRTDNGLEFCNSQFDQFCKEFGVIRNHTVPGTPQQNGLVERMNRTLLNKVRCMLHSSGLPKSFWAEAVVTATYLVNRSPSTAIEMKTPMEMWTGAKQDYSTLRVFGTVAYAHVKEGKLDPRAQKCIFLGYPEGVKGYKLWRLEGNGPRVILSRDVIFQEKVYYKDTIGKKDIEIEDKGQQDETGQVEVEMSGNKSYDTSSNDHNEVIGQTAGDGNSSSPQRYSIALGRTGRQGVKPIRYRSDDEDVSAFVFLADDLENSIVPKTYQEAVESSDKLKWSDYDSSVYFKEYKSDKYVLLLYVDDMLIACEDIEEIAATKHMLSTEFEMKDLGAAKRILGMVIERDRVSAQDSPTTKEAQEFMDQIPYSSIVGSLMYLMVCTRPDTGYGVSLVSRYLANPGKTHWQVVKWLLKYLNGTSSLGLIFGDMNHHAEGIYGYVDADYAKDLDRGRSMTGYIFSVSGGVVSWRVALQNVVALSTTEAEYVSLTEAVKEGIWLRGFVNELRLSQSKTVIKCDNQGVVQLSKFNVKFDKTKHINVKLHFIRDIIKAGEVKVENVRSDENASDMLTKALPCSKFENCLKLVGIG